MSDLFEIRCSLTGDEAEAETPEGALLAASTLIEDACGDQPFRRQDLRRSLQILRNGNADVVLTRRAQRGARHIEEVQAA